MGAWAARRGVRAVGSREWERDTETERKREKEMERERDSKT